MAKEEEPLKTLKFQVSLAEHDDAVVEADEISFHDGAAVFSKWKNSTPRPVAEFAAGVWTEIRRLDK